MENKSFLMICTINELFSTVLKKQSDGELKFDLKDSFLLLCSRDIVTENKKLASYDSYSNEYQSKYKNVDFIPSLIPSASQMEYLGCGDRDTFIDQYTERLYGEAQMKDKSNFSGFTFGNNGWFITQSGLNTNIDYQYNRGYPLINYTQTYFFLR